MEAAILAIQFNRVKNEECIPGANTVAVQAFATWEREHYCGG
jgi:hypothetical protein